MFFSFLVIVSCIAVANGAASIPDNAHSFITVPLRRRAPVSKRTSIDTLATMANNLRQKYNYPVHNLERRQSISTVPITDENADSSYSGELTVGTPSQTFGVILDTGSSDLWLASTACTQGCSGVSTYNPSSSSSFSNKNQQVSITYGSGSVRGQLVSDSVSMGGFTLSQTFLAATQVSSGLLDGSLSGLIGLGFKSIANTEATPFVEALASGSSLSAPLMSVYLARFVDNPNAQNTEPGGVFTLGGTNNTLFQGDIDYVNIPSTVTPGFWLLPVTGITVQGSIVNVPSSSSTPSSGSPFAAIDTGTTLIGGPSDAVAAIYAQIPGSQQGTGQLQGYYTYPCSTQVKMTLTFGGSKSWPINPADFRLQAESRDGSQLCIGALFDLDGGGSPMGGGSGPPRKRQTPTGDSPAWIVGDTFLKNVYTVFRYKPPSVGFAQLAASLPGAGSAPGPAVTGGLNAGNVTPPQQNEADSLDLRAILASALALVGSTLVSHVWY